MTELQDQLQEALGPGYRLGRELGGGGMSRVFLAEEVELGRQVVVKVLPPDMAAGLNAERFRREIQLAASLQHPHIVPLIAAGRSGDLVWYTMPFITGESLRARLAREGELPVGDAVRIMRDVADALTYAHERGVVHRDIKPDNVLIAGKHAVVTDFGVAKAVSASTGESSLTSIGVALGTPAYMAPEQASADPHVDHRADIYSLGVMGYEMLTGRPPFNGPPQTVLAAQVTQAPDHVSTRRDTVPPAVAAVVMRCLAKKPADRFQTAAELHQQLELMATPSGGAVPTTAQPAAARPGRRVGVLVGAAAAVLIAATILVARPWERAGTGGGMSADVIAILPFRVAGADPSMHYLRQGMVDLLQAKLTGDGGPRAADARSVLAAFRDAGGSDVNDVPDGALLPIARKVGAGRVLQGSIVGPPEHVVISATVLAMPEARAIAQTSVEGPRDSLFVLVDRLTARVLALGAGASQQQLSTLTTTNLEALRAYLEGRAAYRRGAFEHAALMLTRAVQLDSTFALALSDLVETSGWVNPTTDIDRVRRLAWQYRDRLAARDQLMLAARLGSRFPRSTPSNESIADRERAATNAPDSPDAWYLLGDALFHEGRLAGIPDHFARAQRAFERAVELDSSFGAPITHLSSLSWLRGDTAGARRWALRALALDTASFGAHVSRVELALAARDEPALRRLMETVLGGQLWVVEWYPLDSLVYANHKIVLETARSRAATADHRMREAATRIATLLNRGRPREARALTDTLRSLSRDRADRIAILAPVVGDGDTAGVDVVAARMPNLFYRELWRLSNNDTRSTHEVVTRLRNDPAHRDTVAESHLREAALLEAWSAALRGDADARRRIALADSLWLGWEEDAALVAPILARLWQSAGEPRRAFEAVRRTPLALGTRPLQGLAPALLIEARVAAASGERDAAIQAYRGYLLWRDDPEPRLVPQRDSARAELAALAVRR